MKPRGGSGWTERWALHGSPPPAYFRAAPWRSSCSGCSSCPGSAPCRALAMSRGARTSTTS
eukprot:10435633-Lingulodinium_polyedra.AAC.1